MSPTLPPRQQLVARDKWPVVGEQTPGPGPDPWTVHVSGLVARECCWTLQELAALPQETIHLDLHCVTRWSKAGVTFSGIRLGDLLAKAGPTEQARFVSFVARSQRSHSTSLVLSEAQQLGTLIALTCDGLPLESQHGGPVRTVVPERYFYKSLKWLARIELLAEDRLGFWEAEAGYHNQADPWQEQRFIVPGWTKQQIAALISNREFAGKDLRGIDVSGHELSGLDAGQCLLRDARFVGCNLAAANFERANLANAHFAGSDLRQAVFFEADIDGTDFSGADLRGADLRAATMLGASFGGQVADDSQQRALVDETTRIDQSLLDQLVDTERQVLLAAS